MALRRLGGLHSQLSCIARQCIAAHTSAVPAQGAGAPCFHDAARAFMLAAASVTERSRLGTGFARSFVAQAAADTQPDDPDLHFTDAAVERLDELAGEMPGQPLLLRLTVEGGGCSGFTYLFDLDTSPADDDRVLQRGAAMLVCDPVSYEFVRGSTVDYTTDIIRSAFEVVSNPNAQGSCGCGSSFAPKA